ncbi:reverse transcriptase [Phytophthora megakarya]|uniref:Reverse transcriptase n=1 Tax=Phytophthora megakarya TaxID=4795 RepID=A0A225VDQ7_9STRA|nr:reverse transcriptase [Phytophthora megakarya]
MKTLILDESWDVTDTEEIAHLNTSIDEIGSRTCNSNAFQKPSRTNSEESTHGLAERWRSIRVHQDADAYLAEIKKFLKEDFQKFSLRTLRKVAKVADLFVLDTRNMLYRLARSTRDRPRDFQNEPRLFVPNALRDDVVHYGHEDFQGGHQGITRTHKKLCSEFYWPENSPNAGPSPGNIEPRQPFEVVSIDFVTPMPKSDRGNTFLLLYMFSGYVMCKPMDSTTDQDVAEAYEERVFRNFGASSMIRHDQDPHFMSEVFTRFRELLNSHQRVTLGYRPQANGQEERSVQTVVRSIRAYIEQADQSDWDDHAERLMFALNTSFDATRLDTPLYLIHSWDPQSTLKAVVGPTPLSAPEPCAEDLQKKARRHRSDVQTRKWKELSERLKSGFQKDDAVWLYIPKRQTGLSKKLAHL